MTRKNIPLSQIVLNCSDATKKMEASHVSKMSFLGGQSILKAIKFNGFTLVELVVVITILTILGSISFVQFGGFLSSARDSARVSNLVTIKSGLDLFRIQVGNYPKPDNNITIMYSGNIFAYQGSIGTNLSSLIQLNAPVKDTKTNAHYPYSVNELQTQYQIGLYLEGGPTTFGKIYYDTAFADTTSSYALGDTVGLLFSDENRIPLNEIKSGDLEVSTLTGSINTLIESNLSITTSGFQLPFLKTIQDKKIGSLLKNDIINGTLRGSWDMETRAGNTLLDISAYGGISYDVGDKIIAGSPGMVGKGTYFSGNSLTGAIIIHDMDGNTDFSFTKAITIEGWINWGGDNSIGSDTEQVIFCAGEWDKSLRIAESGFSGNERQLIANLGTIGEFFSSGTVVPGLWTHVAFTYNGTQGVFYINGVKDSEFSAIGTMSNVSSMVTIGGEIDANPFKGIIDDIRVFNRTLSGEEIGNIYSAIAGSKDIPIVSSNVSLNHNWTTCNAVDEIRIGNGVNEQCWKDRNIGASAVGTGFANAGVFFQWGRNDFLTTGMWFATGNTSTRHSAPGNLVGNNLFITGALSDWKNAGYSDNDLWGGNGTTEGTGTFNSSNSTKQSKMQGPCPSNFHVPTYVELNNAITNAGGYVGFYSLLKPAFGGYKRKSDGRYGDNNSTTNPTSGWSARFWTSTPNPTGDAYYLYIDPTVYDTGLPGSSTMMSDLRAQGLNIRCIKD